MNYYNIHMYIHVIIKEKSLERKFSTPLHQKYKLNMFDYWIEQVKSSVGSKRENNEHLLYLPVELKRYELYTFLHHETHAPFIIPNSLLHFTTTSETVYTKKVCFATVHSFRFLSNNPVAELLLLTFATTRVV